MSRWVKTEGIREFLETVDDPTEWDFFSFVRWVEGAQGETGARVGSALDLGVPPGTVSHSHPYI